MNKLLDPVTRFLATVTCNPIGLAGRPSPRSRPSSSCSSSPSTWSASTGQPLPGHPDLPDPARALRPRPRPHPGRPVADPEAPPGGPRRGRSRRRVRRTGLQPTPDPQDRPRLPGRDRINALILGVGTYKGVEVMESTQFCGAACHSVMEPEYTTYKRSPHARVKCVECHIGEGADWFVKSKLSGSWQLVSVAFDLYSRPIPVPVHNLRPARETCEQCHWPNKFVGDRFQVNTHFAEDEANTETKTVLVVKVGGRRPGAARASTGTWTPTTWCATAPTRSAQEIYEVEVETKDGAKQRFVGPAASHPRGGEGHRVAHDGLRRLPQPADPHLPQPRARARRRPPRPARRPRAAVRPPRGPEGPPGRLPEPRGGPGGHREGDRRLLRAVHAQVAFEKRRRWPRPARPSATSGAGTSSRR